MESKNLNIIQKICHVLEILCRIAYVFCIVGVILTTVAAVLVIISKYIPGAATAIDDYADLSILQVVICCTIGFLACLCGMVPVKLSLNWLKMEQQTGTPFTFEAAQSLRQLGIVYIVVPMVIGLVSAILVAVFHLPESVQVSSDISLGTGILFILLSFVFAYGAELEEANRKN